MRHETIAAMTVVFLAGAIAHGGGQITGRPVSAAGPAAAGDTAGEIRAISGIHGGLVVHLGCGNGRLTAALAEGPNYVVQGLDSDPSNVPARAAHTFDHWDCTAGCRSTTTAGDACRMPTISST